MEIINELKELNLDDNEVKVYLSCLTLGSSKVNEIAKKSELIRTTCYGVLRSLLEKGLISTILKDNVTYFQAANPKQLMAILEEKKKKISSILPKLEKMQETLPVKHNVQLFEGKEGLKTLFNDYVSKPNQIVKIIGFMSKWPDFFGVWTDMYYRKKKENKVKTLVLMDESEREYSKDKRIANSEFRYLKNLDLNSESFIYHDKVAFASFGQNDLKGVIIQDKEMFDLQNKVFDKLWKIAKK